MKIQPSKKNRASTMIATAILAVFIAGFLGVYLLMVSNEYTAVARSQTWNNSINMAESGLEEALTLINKTKTSGSLLNWSPTAVADGWDTNNQATYKNLHWASYTGTGSNTWMSTAGTIFHIRRYLDPAIGYYDVYVNSSVPYTNEILSVGTAVSDVRSATRKIYIKAVGIPEFAGAGVIAYAGMDFKGNNVTVDSWNSASTNNSIWHTNLFFRGQNYGTWSNSLSYNSNSPPSRTANVFVATDGYIIDVGNANIYGYLDTAPGGTSSVGAQGSVGDLNWVHNGTHGIQTGHAKDDMNKTFFSKDLPIPTNAVQTTPLWWPVPQPTTNIIIGGTWTNIAGHWTNWGGTTYANNGSGYTIDGNTYALVITNRPETTNYLYYAYYSPSALSQNIYVDAPYTVLCLSNGLSGGQFTVNTNADVEVWSMDDISFGQVNNGSANTHAFTIRDVAGHPINISASGNASGVASIITPSASITFNGGGNNTYDVVGEIFCKDIKVNGHFNFHFDESLATTSAAEQFLTVSWKEVQ